MIKMKPLKNKILKQLEKILLPRKNVIGFSSVLMPRQLRDGTILENELCIRVYVTKKEDLSALEAKDVIPKLIKLRSFAFFGRKYPTDVVEIGEVKALKEKTEKWRPVELGVSIGHWDITAGSLGMTYSKNNVQLQGSNAHVVTDEPSKEPEEIIEKRICQPGPYHDPNKSNNVVGSYYWHQKLYPDETEDGEKSNCKISNAIIWLLNFISNSLGRRTRFKTFIEGENYIDFGVYKETTEHLFKFADNSIAPEQQKFIGHLFAGSPWIGVICKIKYIMAHGFTPLGAGPAEPELDAQVIGSSFWCNFRTTVYDPSATIKVNYGEYMVTFKDCILVRNKDNIIRGGWSGSAWFLV